MDDELMEYEFVTEFFDMAFDPSIDIAREGIVAAIDAIVAEAVRQAGDIPFDEFQKARINHLEKSVSKLFDIGSSRNAKESDVESRIDLMVKTSEAMRSIREERYQDVIDRLDVLDASSNQIRDNTVALHKRIAALEHPEPERVGREGAWCGQFPECPVRVGVWCTDSKFWKCNCLNHLNEFLYKGQRVQHCSTCNTRRPEPVTEAVTYGEWVGDGDKMWTCNCPSGSRFHPDGCYHDIEYIKCGVCKTNRPKLEPKKYGCWTDPPAVAWHCRCDGNTVNYGERCELCDHHRPEGEVAE